LLYDWPLETTCWISPGSHPAGNAFVDQQPQSPTILNDDITWFERLLAQLLVAAFPNLLFFDAD